MLSQTSFKFDQVYRKSHQHPQDQISFIKLSIEYVFINCRCYYIFFSKNLVFREI